GLRQKGKNARRSWPKRDKPMRHPSGQGDGVIGGHDAALIADPHLQRAVEHDDDFVGGVVEMRWCAGTRLDDAETRRASDALLREEPNRRVWLLEAGGWDKDPWIHIPLGWGRILNNRMHDWMYFAEPEATMGGRRVECARGKVIGGSSSINAMVYVRGNRADY